MNEISEWLTRVVDGAPSWAVYLVVFTVVYLEVAVLICGLILPSEAVLIAAGVAAAIGQPNIVALMACASCAALLGDLTGYYVGKCSGPRLEHTWAGRKFGHENWLKAEERVRSQVWVTVPIGRWIGYVRTLIPVAAGMSEVDVRKYAIATYIGGTTWSAAVLGLAFWMGAAAGVDLIGVLVITLVAVGIVIEVVRWFLGRRRDARNAVAGIVGDDMKV